MPGSDAGDGELCDDDVDVLLLAVVKLQLASSADNEQTKCTVCCLVSSC